MGKLHGRTPTSSRPGTTGNVIAALASFFVPGLGQLLQGRVTWAIVWFLASIVVWIVTLGLLGGVVHVLACIHAAVYNR
jgi:TM2 domain-containing membrane protein YozV